MFLNLFFFVQYNIQYVIYVIYYILSRQGHGHQPLHYTLQLTKVYWWFIHILIRLKRAAKTTPTTSSLVSHSCLSSPFISVTTRSSMDFLEWSDFLTPRWWCWCWCSVWVFIARAWTGVSGVPTSLLQLSGVLASLPSSSDMVLGLCRKVRVAEGRRRLAVVVVLVVFEWRCGLRREWTRRDDGKEEEGDEIEPVCWS